MSDRHEQLFQAVQKALQALYADQSVPKSTTRESLQTIRDELAIDIEALGDDEDDEPS